jgi:hypothetical protein
MMFLMIYVDFMTVLLRIIYFMLPPQVWSYFVTPNERGISDLASSFHFTRPDDS